MINKWRKETLGLLTKRSVFTNDLMLDLPQDGPQEIGRVMQWIMQKKACFIVFLEIQLPQRSVRIRKRRGKKSRVDGSVE